MISEDAKRARIAVFSGLASLCVLFTLFILTEYLTDASITLLRVRLALCSIVLLPFVAYNIKNRWLSHILSLGTLVCIIILCSSMYVDRNRAVRLFVKEPKLTEAQSEAIIKLLERPVIVLLATENDSLELTDELVEYADLDTEVREAINARIKPTRAPMVSDPNDAIDTPVRSDVRFSGVKERVVIVITGDVITEGNFRNVGFKELGDSGVE